MGPLSRVRLSEPTHAREDARCLFDPSRGWFRRLERRVSNVLASRVFPALPGLSGLYDRQLKRGLVLSEAELVLARLPPVFDGLRILFISDIHAGTFVSPKMLGATFQRLLSTEPDVILVGGDLVTVALEEFVETRAAFAKLRAPMGVFAVLGNHDHYTRDPDRLTDMIEEAGIRVLHNRSVALRRGHASLSLLGVDDLNAGQPNLEAALVGTHSPVLLLTHNPDLAFDAARRGVALTLSGHTHGGQIRVPGFPPLVRQSRYRLDEGRYRVGRMELVVSRGLGASGLPVRFACPPEDVLIHLRSHPPG
jgi:predicted MPP superfamily phosphohydrolase